MEIKGQITEIIYTNEINGYMVAEFKTEEETTVITGYLPFINDGDSLRLVGKFVTHPDYGRQFKIETFEKIMPETLEALERYLAGGIITGVGPATAKKIIEKFGEETLHVLRFEPEKLEKIKGINSAKAVKISEEFAEKWDLWEIVGFLEKCGAKTLFATHYHELTELESKLEGVKNYSIAVKEKGEDIIFLRKIIPGGTDESYGIHVAKLAGVPQPVVKRSNEILRSLERKSMLTGQKKQENKKQPEGQLDFYNYKLAEIAHEIDKINLNETTPIDALNTLIKIKEKMQ